MRHVRAADAADVPPGSNAPDVCLDAVGSCCPQPQYSSRAMTILHRYKTNGPPRA